jgi:hypothetical protein
MNQKNIDYLASQVMYTGFGNSHEAQLAENTQKGKPAFTLEHQAVFGADVATATLHFQKSKTTDNYFFNNYELEVKKQDGNSLKQTFQMGYDNNITFKEAVNLLSGRAVFKELAKLIDTGENGQKRLEPKGEKYNAWLQLDFTDTDARGNFKIKPYHENYGFKLEETLARYPIKELEHPESKARLLESLQKGNQQSVTFVVDGKEEKRFVEAAPRFKAVNQYDENGIRTGFSRQQKEEPSQGKSQQQEAPGEKKAQGEKQDQDPEKKQQRSRKAKSIA